MKRFTRLFSELDESNRTNLKVAALERYFREAPPEDAAWALFFLCGKRLPRPVNSTRLRECVSELSGFPGWLVDECYELVGDLAETLALLLPEGKCEAPLFLHEVVEGHVIPLRDLPEAERIASLLGTWRLLNLKERFVFNKLITGAFRVGVQRTLVVRALAAVAGVPAAVMAHRVIGDWQTSAAGFAAVLEGGQSNDEAARPYPFCLAYPWEGEAEISLGALEQWQVEWKWDGIRAQLIKRGIEVVIWSRGEDMLTDRFPEIADAAALLSDSVVLDGEILAWSNGSPLPFGSLQRRIGRKNVTPRIRREVPVVFMAYDCLEKNGSDMRDQSTQTRRAGLESLVHSQPEGSTIMLSPLVQESKWSALRSLLLTSRDRGVEGFMLKRRDARYRVGRVKGDWWKWKIDPFTIDTVMVYAQAGHGRRAGLFTDYTFAVWDGDRLLPVAKAYSGLTDVEIREVDAFVRANTLERFGPVRVVKPALVFELAFDGIRESKRHKSGIALRFPRMSRWRRDKPAGEADSLQSVRALLPGQAG